MKIPTWKELESSGEFNDYQHMFQYLCRLHVQAALICASEKGGLNVQPLDEEEWEVVPQEITRKDIKDLEDFWICIDKESILNCYPLENVT
jgi:hypothetical protein